MTTTEHLDRLDRVVTALLHRVEWMTLELLEHVPSERFAEIQRRETLTLLNSALDDGDENARASMDRFGLSAPPIHPARRNGGEENGVTYPARKDVERTLMEAQASLSEARLTLEKFRELRERVEYASESPQGMLEKVRDAEKDAERIVQEVEEQMNQTLEVYRAASHVLPAWHQ